MEHFFFLNYSFWRLAAWPLEDPRIVNGYMYFLTALCSSVGPWGSQNPSGIINSGYYRPLLLFPEWLLSLL